MKLEDIPDLKGARYPHRITLCVSSETQAKIKKLKEVGKDPHALLRKKIEELLLEIAV